MNIPYNQIKKIKHLPKYSNNIMSCKNNDIIEEINIDNKTTYLNDFNFENCSALKTVKISNVIELGESCFKNCSSLTTLSHSSIKFLNSNCFDNTNINNFNISNIEGFGSNVLESLNNPTGTISKKQHLAVASFKDCFGISDLDIEFEEVIPKECFKNSSLRYLHNTDLIKIVGESAFEDCANIDYLRLENVKIINKLAFANSSLKFLYLPNCEFVNDFAFSGLSCNIFLFNPNVQFSPNALKGFTGKAYGLNHPLLHNIYSCFTFLNSETISQIHDISESLAIPDISPEGNEIKTVLANIPEDIIYYIHPPKKVDRCYIASQMKFVDCGECSSMTTIFEFHNNSRDLEVIYGKNILSIPDDEFLNCPNLRIAEFNNATHIGEYAFKGCSNLTQLIIPNVQQIATEAFNNTNIQQEVFENVVSIDLSGFKHNVYLMSESLTSISTTNFTHNVFVLNDTVKSRLSDDKVFSLDDMFEILDNKIISFKSDYSKFNNRVYLPNVTEIIALPSETTLLNFPSSIQILPDYAFKNMSEIPTDLSGVSHFGNYCLENTSAEFIFINSTATFSENAFVRYNGNIYTENPNVKNHGCLNVFTPDDEQIIQNNECIRVRFLPNSNSVLTITPSTTLSTLKGSNLRVHSKYSQINFNGSICSLEDNENVETVSLSSTTIPNYTFKGCSGLKTLLNTSAITSVGESAFEDTVQLSNLTFDNCLSVSKSSFKNSCLKHVSLPACTSISESTFENCLFEDSTNISIPLVSTLPNYSFKGCKHLKTFISSFITTINNEVFDGCNILTEIQIPNCSRLGNNCLGVAKKIILGNITQQDALNLPLTTEDLEINTTNNLTSSWQLNRLPIKRFKSSSQNILENTFKDCNTLQNVIMENLTSLGTSAFENCVSLTTFVYGSLTTIPNNCFKNCQSFTFDFSNITNINEGAFEGCDINEITSQTLVNISSYAFRNCHISTITTPQLTSLGITPFYNCPLTNITFNVSSSNSFNQLPNTVKYINSLNVSTIDSNFTIPENLETFETNAVAIKCKFPTSIKNVILNNNCDIYDNVFENCSSLKYVNGDGTKKLFKECFKNCSSLEHVYNISYLSMSTFENCYSLNAISTTSLTTIPSKAFINCSSLTNFTFDNINTVSDSAFENSGLQEVVFNTTATIGSYSFKGCANLSKVRGGKTFNEDSFASCSSLSTVVCTNITTIPNGCFENCVNLSTIHLPNVTKIGNRSFGNCVNLLTFDFLSITSIGNNAFEGSGLHSAYLNSNAVIGESAFKNCSNLGVINGGKTFNSYSLDGCSSLSEFISNVGLLPTGLFNDCTNLSTCDIKNCLITDTSMFSNVNELKNLEFYVQNEISIPDLPTTLKYLGLNMSGTTFTSGMTDKINDVESLKLYNCNIGESAFEDCAKFSHITITGCTSVSTMAFNNLSSNSLSCDCKYCSSYSFQNVNVANVELPELLNVSSYAFNGASGFTSLDLTKCTRLYNNAFDECKVKNINLSSCADISEYVFNNCTSLTSVSLSPSLTKIPNYAFYNCESLNSIPNSTSLTSIGISGFEKCSTLSDVSLGNVELTNSSFKDCLLSSITGNIKTIGESCFENNNISNISLSSSITSIPNNCFKNCKLTSISSWVVNIGKYAYKGNNINELELGNNCVVGNYAFEDCELLETVVGGKTFGDYSFNNCVGLEMVNNSYLTSLSTNVFNGCNNLVNLNISNCTINSYITSLPLETLYCKYTTNTTTFIPTSVNWLQLNMANNNFTSDITNSLNNLSQLNLYNCNIGESAFENCTKFSNVVISSCTSVSTYAFKNCTCESVMCDCKYCSSYSFQNVNVGNIELPELLSVSNSAFNRASGFTSISLPKVTNVSSYAFKECNVENINLNSCLTVSDNAFELCNNLTNISLSKCTTVGVEAFNYCGNLTNISLPNVTTIASHCFTFCAKLSVIDVPKVSVIRSVGFGRCTSLTNITLPAVTSIDGSAFIGCENLVEVNLTNLTSIGEKCFNDCVKLTKINIPKITTLSNYCFQNCHLLQTVIVSPDLTEIPDYCFENCSSLQNIPNETNITSIGERAFKYCSSITTATFNHANIGKSAFTNCYNLSSIQGYIDSLDEYAFYNCSSLSSNLYLSNATIGDYAFYNCSKLPGLREAPKTIGKEAFRNCTSLTYVSGTNTTNIGSDCFYNCTSLTYISVPNCSDLPTLTHLANLKTLAYKITNISIPSKLTSLTINCAGSNYTSDYTSSLPSLSNCSLTLYNSPTIGDYAFKDCTKFNNIVLDSSCKTAGTYCFYNCVADSISSYIITANNYAFAYLPNCTSLTLTSLTTCEDSVFTNSLNLTYLGIPSCTTIGNYICDNCVKLKSANLPNCSTLGEYAFRSCYSLTNITVSTKLTKISDRAFPYCSSLTFIPNMSKITEYGISSFEGCNALTSITLATGATVKDYGFYSCKGLKSVNGTPNSFGARAFYDCNLLTYITMSTTLKNIPDYCFTSCYSLTTITLNHVTSIGKNSFENCSSLKYVSVSTCTISDYAFSNCTSLTKLDGSTTNFSSYSFHNCTALTYVTFSSTLRNIGSYSFYNCSALSSITTNLSYATTIGNYAFYKCGLKTITLGDVNLGSGAFNFCTVLTTANGNPKSFGEKCFEDCSILDTISWSSSTLLNIPNYCFRYCYKLANIPSLNKITNIGNGGFYSCHSLTSIALSSTATLGQQAFANARGLKIVYGGKVFGANCFANCTSLTAVTSTASVVSIGDNCFINCPKLDTLYLTNCISVGTTPFPINLRNLELIKIDDVNALTSLASLTSIGFNTTNTIDNIGFSKITNLKRFYASYATSVSTYAFSGCTALTKLWVSSATTCDYSCLPLGSTNLQVLNVFRLPLSTTFVNNIPLSVTELYIKSTSYTTLPTNLSRLTSLNFLTININGYTFYSTYTKSLTSIVPQVKNLTLNGVGSVDTACFSGITQFSYITIYTTYIGSQGFYKCSVYSITVSAKDIGYGAFDQCTATYIYCSTCTTISNSFAFAALKNCLSLDLPNLTSCYGSLDNTGGATGATFRNSTKLTSINAPKCPQFPYQAFRSCSSLKTLNISSCTKIGYEALTNVNSLTTLTIGCTNVTDIKYGFGNTTNNTVSTLTLTQSVNSLVSQSTTSTTVISCQVLNSLFPNLLELNLYVTSSLSYAVYNLLKLKKIRFYNLISIPNQIIDSNLPYLEYVGFLSTSVCTFNGTRFNWSSSVSTSANSLTIEFGNATSKTNFVNKGTSYVVLTGKTNWNTSQTNKIIISS